jgi:CBS domain-containing protein
VPRIGDFVEATLTCSPDEPLSSVAARAREQGASICVVLDAAGIVLGTLRSALRREASDRVAAEVMHPSPQTFRPDVPVDEPVEYMERRHFEETLVTTPEGRLLGIARIDAPRRLLAELRRHHAEVHGGDSD